MADEFAQFGGAEIEPDEFAEFGGGALSPDEIIGLGLAKKDQVLSLGEAIMEALRHAIVQQPLEQMQFIKGLGQGSVRIPAASDASQAEQTGTTLGRAIPPAAGALAAGAATGGAGLIPAVLASGVGAAVGNTASQVGAKLAGGEAPESIGAATAESAKVGLATAATELGVGGLLAGVAKAAPKFVSAFKTFPSESLKRILKRPEEVFGVFKDAPSKSAQTVAELRGVKALRDVQNGVIAARKTAGQEVERALIEFGQVTKGQKIIDPKAIADAGLEALAVRSTESGVTPIAQSELDEIMGLIGTLRKETGLSARDAVIWRRKLDAAIEGGGGVPGRVSSKDGSGVIAEMATRMRELIGEQAQAFNFARLANANANFSRIATGYDAIRGSLITKTMSPKEAVKRIESLANDFNKGGLTQEQLTEIGQALPGTQKAMDDLLDAIAARALTLESKGSPSSGLMSMIRFLAGPDGLNVAAQAARKTPVGAVRRAAGATVAGVRGANK